MRETPSSTESFDARSARTFAVRAAAYRQVAAATIVGAVEILRSSEPTSDKARRAWQTRRDAEIRFFADPRRSAHWCEAAGLDWDFVVGKLSAEGLLSLNATTTAQRHSVRSGVRRRAQHRSPPA